MPRGWDGWQTLFFINNHRRMTLSRKKFPGLIFLTAFLFPIFVVASTDVVLKIDSNEGRLFYGPVSFEDCFDSQFGQTKSPNAFCPIDKISADKNWEVKKTWYPFGLMLDGISDYTTDASTGKFWTYFLNGEPGTTSLNSEILKDGDKLSLFFGISPLKLKIKPDEPIFGDPVSIQATFFDFSEWLWRPAGPADFFVDDLLKAEASEEFNFLGPTGVEFEIFARKEGFSDSDSAFVRFKSEILPSTSFCGKCVLPGKIFIPDQALDFLISKADKNGRFEDEMLSDWVAIAFSAIGYKNDFAEKIKDLIATRSFGDGWSLTDYERRAMVLMSMGIRPDRAEANYIEKIKSFYKNGQFGEENLINDDIFAILVLKKAGADPNGKMTESALDFVLSRQSADGSFGGLDLTGAAMSIFSMFPAEPKIYEATQRAIEYLRKEQREDGGFGNPFSTSWVLQGIVASGFKPENFYKNGKTPLQYLGDNQAFDGGILVSEKASDRERIWATAYAIPASIKATWPDIIKDFPPPAEKKEKYLVEAGRDEPDLLKTEETSLFLIKNETVAEENEEQTIFSDVSQTASAGSVKTGFLKFVFSIIGRFFGLIK